MEIKSNSATNTQKIARDLTSDLKSGIVIALFGDLGSGKTTFTQGIGQKLGVKRITSPTYTIMREYQIKNHSPIQKLFHVDLYRFKTISQDTLLDLQEIWSDPQNLVVIEWSEKIDKFLPQNTTKVFFEIINENKRKITIEK